MKKFIVLDTNILVNFLESGFRIETQAGIFKESEDIKMLEELLNSVDKDLITLLLPEITITEVTKIKPEKEKDLQIMYEEVMKPIRDFTSSKGKKISNIILDNIEDHMNNLYEEQEAKINDSWELLDKIIKNKKIVILPLSEQILLAAYKRGIEGKKPYVPGWIGKESALSENRNPSHDIQPDCVFIESIINFLKDEKDVEVYFGSDDSDFYTDITKAELDPSIKEELKVKIYSTKLSDLLIEAIGLKITKQSSKKQSEEQSTYPVVGKVQIEGGEVVSNIDTSDVIKG